MELMRKIFLLFFIATCVYFHGYGQKIMQGISSIAGYNNYLQNMKLYEDSLQYYKEMVSGNYTPAERKIIIQNYLQSQSIYKKKLAEFSVKNNNNEWGAIALLSAIYTQSEADFSSIVKYSENLTEKGLQNFYAEELNKIISARKNIEMNKLAHISLPDKQGKNINISDINAKYIIINFWASWCGPCRAKNSQLQKIYVVYKNKGLEIVSISVDLSRQAWLNASSADKINWINLHAAEGFQDRTSVFYNVTSVPRTFFYNKEKQSLQLLTSLDDVLNEIKR